MNYSVPIGIIIPAYNAEKTIKNCIESILNQTHTKWIAYVIDDGSTDSTPSILETFANNDERIHVYRQKNGGVSEARNTGLTLAKTPYIMMVDSDDSLPEHAIEYMLKAAKLHNDCDFVISSFTRTNPNGKKTTHNIGIEDGLNNLISQHITKIPGAPWAKLYKKSIIDATQLRFVKDLKVSEDNLFVKCYLSQVKKITVVNSSLYNYEFSPSSVIHRFETGAAPFDVYADVLSVPLRISEWLKLHPATNAPECDWNSILLADILNNILWLEWSLPSNRRKWKRHLRLQGIKYAAQLAKEMNIIRALPTICKYLTYYLKGRMKRLIHRQ